jgi:hypothetical protein
MKCAACDGGQYQSCPYCGGSGKITLAANRAIAGHRAGEPVETLETA